MAPPPTGYRRRPRSSATPAARSWRCASAGPMGRRATGRSGGRRSRRARRRTFTEPTSRLGGLGVRGSSRTAAHSRHAYVEVLPMRLGAVLKSKVLLTVCVLAAGLGMAGVAGGDELVKAPLTRDHEVPPVVTHTSPKALFCLHKDAKAIR